MKRFGDFEFDDRRRALRLRGRTVRLSGQAIDLLCLLLERPGELVSREEIELRLWPDTHVNFDHSLDVVVSRLRTALSRGDPSSRYIETVPRRGYRFSEPVRAADEGSPASALPAWKRRAIIYASVAILAAMMAVAFARTRYDKLVPRQGTRAAPTAPAHRP